MQSKSSTLEDGQDEQDENPDEQEGEDDQGIPLSDEEETSLRNAGYVVGIFGLLFLLLFFACHAKLVWNIWKSMRPHEEQKKNISDDSADEVGDEDTGIVKKQPGFQNLRV